MLEQLVPVDHLGPDEAPLQVGVDHARALGCLGAGAERPRPRLLVARREERAPAEQVVRRAATWSSADSATPYISRISARASAASIAAISASMSIGTDSARQSMQRRSARLRRLLAGVAHDEHGLVGEEEHGRQDVASRPASRPARYSGVPSDRIGSTRSSTSTSAITSGRRLQRLAVTRSSRFSTLLDVGHHELELDRGEVAVGIGLDSAVGERAQHDEDRVGVAQRTEELRAEAFAGLRAGRRARGARARSRPARPSSTPTSPRAGRGARRERSRCRPRPRTRSAPADR